MHVNRIQLTVKLDGEDFDVEAWLDGAPVARAQGLREDDRLVLADICVSDDVRPRWPVLHGMLVSLIGPRKPLRLRGRGIGEMLLARMLREADSRGISEITGSVMPEAITVQPFLLGWYEDHGFVVTDPDAGCVRGAAKKIVRRLQR
jgi:hypothetical protein